MGRFNEGIDFDTCCAFSCRINLPSVLDDVTNLINRRGKDKLSQVASLLRAVTCLDLTTLSGDDTYSNVQQLCHKAENPIDKEILTNLGFDSSEISCAAVCVYPSKIRYCVDTLENLSSSLPVAAVAAGFPSGQYEMKTKLQEIELCVQYGAKEIDIVISRELVLSGKWKELYDEVKEMCSACGDKAIMKTIIATGELGSLSNVYNASMICMAAGTDFIKTSTGKESVNATLPVGTVMARAVYDYYMHTGYKVGFKPAGGIRTSKDVLLWQELMEKELGKEWLYSDLFRIGASSLLLDMEQTIIQAATGGA